MKAGRSICRSDHNGDIPAILSDEENTELQEILQAHGGAPEYVNVSNFLHFKFVFFKFDNDCNNNNNK